MTAVTAGVDARARIRRRYRGGWRIVARKEFGDHVRSVRFVILVILVVLAGLASVQSASGPIKDAADAASQTPSIFLYLFTLSPQSVPAFHEFIGILGPLLGIAFGFDAINGERAQRTLPRLVSQPIHRDEIINGKFVAGLGAIALALACLVAMVAGYGALRLGMGPTLGDVARIVAFYVVTLVYIALWLALSLLLSVGLPAGGDGGAGGDRRVARADPVHRPDRQHDRRLGPRRERRLDHRGGARQRPHRADRPPVLARPAVQGRHRRPPQPVAAVDRHRRRDQRHLGPADQPARSTRACCWRGGRSSCSSPGRSCCSPPPTPPSCARRSEHDTLDRPSALAHRCPSTRSRRRRVPTHGAADPPHHRAAASAAAWSVGWSAVAE